jgi:alkyl hydroperoxide reductase subunit AhpC
VLADFHPKGQVAQLYGVYNDQRGTANRAVFVIDKQGIVRFKKTYAQAADLNPADILAEVDKLPKK